LSRAPSGRWVVLVVFGVAAAVRIVAALQYTEAPNFEYPIGDAAVHLSRAREILDGDLLGREIYFHSSPLYAYFVALVLWLTDNSFLALRAIQSILGALSCVVIALLARRAAGGDVATGLVAGLAAAGYGTLAFFDLDLLMISQTVLLVGTCLLFLARFHESRSSQDLIVAALALGLAATDKPNLLLFVPVAAWLVAGSFTWRLRGLNWRPACLFVAATLVVILPVTLRNLVVGNDLVLVSSNGGVNFYIGNNPDSPGTYLLPPDSGLQNFDLHGSSVAIAEKATERPLKPSQVSRFWAGKAWRFIADDPLREAWIVGLKLKSLVNAYEVPNHLNLYYMRDNFIPLLRWLRIGAWLVFPLGIVGIAWRWARGATSIDRLLCGYLAAYCVSLLPFFVTARYRLPLVPVLLVYAALLVTGVAGNRSGLSRRRTVLLAVGLAVAVVAVHWPASRHDYSFDRVAMATKYYERSRHDLPTALLDLREAVVQLKWATETAPHSADAHYNLGVALESVGYYSGAAAEFRQVLDLAPDRTLAAVALEGVQRKLSMRGDRATARDLPLTPYEQALTAERGGQPETAERLYRRLVDRDPFHFAAYAQLGRIHASQDDWPRAIRALERAAKLRPGDDELVAARNNVSGHADRQRALVARRGDLGSRGPAGGLRDGSSPGRALRAGRLAAGSLSCRVAGWPACRHHAHLRAQTRGAVGSPSGRRGIRRDRPTGDTGRRELGRGRRIDDLVGCPVVRGPRFLWRPGRSALARRSAHPLHGRCRALPNQPADDELEHRTLAVFFSLSRTSTPAPCSRRSAVQVIGVG
jgi:tetratricopeptide (TPR) repeat protein